MADVKFVVVSEAGHLVRTCAKDPTEFLLHGQRAVGIEEAWDAGIVSRHDLTRDGRDIDPGNHL